MSVAMAKGKKGLQKSATPQTEGQADEPEPTSTGSIRIKPDLAYKLRIIVEADKTSAADFLDPIIRQTIETNFTRVSRRLAQLAADQNPPDDSLPK